MRLSVVFIFFKAHISQNRDSLSVVLTNQTKTTKESDEKICAVI